MSRLFSIPQPIYKYEAAANSPNNPLITIVTLVVIAVVVLSLWYKQ